MTSWYRTSSRTSSVTPAACKRKAWAGASCSLRSARQYSSTEMGMTPRKAKGAQANASKEASKPQADHAACRTWRGDVRRRTRESCLRKSVGARALPSARSLSLHDARPACGEEGPAGCSVDTRNSRIKSEDGCMALRVTGSQDNSQRRDNEGKKLTTSEWKFVENAFERSNASPLPCCATATAPPMLVPLCEAAAGRSSPLLGHAHRAPAAASGFAAETRMRRMEGSGWQKRGGTHVCWPRTRRPQ